MELRLASVRIGHFNNTLGSGVMDQFTRRIVGFGAHRGIRCIDSIDGKPIFESLK